jgi:D-tyrosyl-tRNA(Tyr) deacylase
MDELPVCAAILASMRALVQRVSRAAVRVDGLSVAEIGAGLLVLLGVAREDDEAAAARLAEKVRALRVFADADGHMNEPLGARELLCVSQFTLYGETRKGNRPSFTAAAEPERARALYEYFCERAGAHARGVFGAHMEVELVNDGPVTLIVEVGAGGHPQRIN